MKKEILISRFSSLGDLVTLEPMLRALRWFHRDARILFVTSELGKSLYGDRFDLCVAYSPGGSGRWRQATELADRITEHMETPRLERVYDLQASTLSLLLAMRLGSRSVIYQGTRPWQKLIGYKRRGLDTPQLLRAAGFTAAEVTAYWADEMARQIVLPVAEAEALTFRQQFGERSRKIAVLAPGASERWRSKQWGEQRFATLAQRLAHQGFQMVIVGSLLEVHAARVIQSAVPEAMDFTGKTSVSALVGLLSQADLFVGNDSGPSHLAAGVGVPTLTLFGPTGVKHCPAQMDYRGVHRCLAPQGVPCHPCYKPECPTHHECMQAIDVDTVYRQCLELCPVTDALA